MKARNKHRFKSNAETGSTSYIGLVGLLESKYNNKGLGLVVLGLVQRARLDLGLLQSYYRIFFRSDRPCVTLKTQRIQREQSQQKDAVHKQRVRVKRGRATTTVQVRCIWQFSNDHSPTEEL